MHFPTVELFQVVVVPESSKERNSSNAGHRLLGFGTVRVLQSALQAKATFQHIHAPGRAKPPQVFKKRNKSMVMAGHTELTWFRGRGFHNQE